MTGSLLAAAGTAHTAANLRLLRTPPADPPPVGEPVAVLLPVRDEARRVEPCLRSLLAQTGVPDLRVLVLDDGSTDGTADVVRRVAGDDPRLTLLTGAPLPPGWWGKPHACQQLATAALTAEIPPSVLVFVDADVVLAPHAVAAAVTLLRDSGLDLVSPYPRQVAVSPAERLVQPLLQWSWLTTLPLRLAERSPRPSLAAANGQLLVVDAAAYQRAGGHATVRAEMLEDIALLRSVKRSGGRGVAVDGSRVATCRMYDGWPALRDGYHKSLWSAFGSPAGAAAVMGLLGLAYVVPPVAALRGSRVGLAGYLAAVGGRLLVDRRVGARGLPDALAHPASVLLLAWLTAGSMRGRRAGTLSARGRPVP
ncbi:MAG TPA: glycosyltransferase family 2 protein [Actinomycetes bacterium]